MQVFRLSSESDYYTLRDLWKICFNADQQFLSLYFSKGIQLTRTYVISYKNEIISALSVFNLELNGSSGRYIYGVCTHPSHRGKNYAAKLLHYAEQKELESGASFFITRPASPTLFDYYHKGGYTFPIDRSETTIAPDNNPMSEIPEELDGIGLYLLRSKFFNIDYFSWGIKECEYIIDYVKYCRGCCLSFRNEKYLIGYPENQTFIILESNLNTQQIASFIRTFQGSCNKSALYSRAENANRKPFALLKTTENTLHIDKDTIFSFAME